MLKARRAVRLRHGSGDAVSRDGEIATFKNGLERVLARRPVPVIPLALCGMWASMWSQRDPKLRRLRVPRRLRAHVGLIVGAPVPASEASAKYLETIVRELRGDSP